MNSYYLLDHPVIRNMERTGFPDGVEPECPHCPICGEACETVYLDAGGAYVGCSERITARDAWDMPSCFPDGFLEDL